jgi:hypothetical protein
MASNLFLESAKIPDASLDADAIGKKKYGFSQISLAVPTNLIDDCVIGIPLAAAVSGVNPWTFRQWIKQGRGPPLVRLALRTLNPRPLSFCSDVKPPLRY